MNVADFAALVGTTSKTIYQKIMNNDELPVNEQLITVKEKVKGRETTLILTNSAQIKLYKDIYGKQQVINDEYYETLTENNSKSRDIITEESPKPSNNNEYNNNLFDKLLTVTNQFNERYEQKITELMEVHNELAEVRGRQFLLEDKAGREGFYINEINGLKKDNKKLIKVIYGLITVLVIVLISLTGYITYNVTVNNSENSEGTIKNYSVEENIKNSDLAKNKFVKIKK